MTKTSTIVVDLAKSVFEIAAADEQDRIVFRRRLSRSKFREFLAKQEPAEILMEACGSAHFWARTAKRFGHRPTLLPPSYVRPFVLRNKTDRTDTTGLLRAGRDREIKPVPTKSEHQQTLTAIHALRTAWSRARTRRISTVRGILRELGVFIPQGARFVAPRLATLLEDGTEVPAALLPLLAEARDEILSLDHRIKAAEDQLRAIAGEDDIVRRLMTIPGVGLLTAAALVAAIGDFSRFPSGRRFASFLGITPRERSSGSYRRLGPISKRGDSYLRTLLVHGARSSLLAGKRSLQPDRLRSWAVALESRTCHNLATVALANKMARIAWAIATRSTTYEPRTPAA